MRTRAFFNLLTLVMIPSVVRSVTICTFLYNFDGKQKVVGNYFHKKLPTRQRGPLLFVCKKVLKSPNCVHFPGKVDVESD
ncbi:unnamed protein product [Chondrus crispus]|uniref:Secreted protein n=1 Tax=Chondrus crispus TaxID=2769 RepID=R7QPS0_CHOCR|nr:unnamed protein product [Chondrus crispus]CDF39783.1 unnamed protein product [Chondrus crispus]|eukprot:XP_005710077.1 unnamed protein product [Chondrus crispus]